MHSCATLGLRNGFLLALLALGIGWFAEWLGLQYGFPFFERYEYHPDLKPTLGSVPIFIPISWWVLAYMPIVYLRLMKTSGAQGTNWSNVVCKTLLCSLCLTGADLLLDPLAHEVNGWTWLNGGNYFGVPIANYAGWFLVHCSD